MAARENINSVDSAIRKLKSLNRVKDDAMRNLSHDMRNALNTIIGLASVIHDEELRDIDEIKRISGVIKRNGMNLLLMVDNLLDSEKIEHGTLNLTIEEINLSKFLHNLREDHSYAAGQKDISIDLTMPGKEIFIEADRVKLLQVFNNLMTNAVKFTEAGGHVQLFMKQLNAEHDDPQILISLKDNGIGIPDEFMPKLFKKFGIHHRPGTNKEQGIGVGLSVVKHIIELHHGSIDVESEVDVGSTFFVRLPLTQPNQQTADKQVASS